MENRSRRVFLTGCAAVAFPGFGGCSFRERPMAGFSLINESSRAHAVQLEVTAIDGGVLHDESYRVDPGWSRLSREGVFEAQKSRFEITVDGEFSDEYEFLPSCTDPEFSDDALDIVIDPPDIEYFPKRCGG